MPRATRRGLSSSSYLVHKGAELNVMRSSRIRDNVSRSSLLFSRVCAHRISSNSSTNTSSTGTTAKPLSKDSVPPPAASSDEHHPPGREFPTPEPQTAGGQLAGGASGIGWRPSEAHRASATAVRREKISRDTDETKRARVKSMASRKLGAVGQSDERPPPGMRRRALLTGATEALSHVPASKNLVQRGPGSSALLTMNNGATSAASSSATQKYRERRALERLAASGNPEAIEAVEAVEALRASERLSSATASGDSSGGGDESSRGFTPFSVLPLCLALVGIGYCYFNDLMPGKERDFIGDGRAPGGTSRQGSGVARAEGRRRHAMSEGRCSADKAHQPERTADSVRTEIAPTGPAALLRSLSRAGTVGRRSSPNSKNARDAANLCNKSNNYASRSGDVEDRCGESELQGRPACHTRERASDKTEMAQARDACGEAPSRLAERNWDIATGPFARGVHFVDPGSGARDETLARGDVYAPEARDRPPWLQRWRPRSSGPTSRPP